MQQFISVIEISIFCFFLLICTTSSHVLPKLRKYSIFLITQRTKCIKTTYVSSPISFDCLDLESLFSQCSKGLQTRMFDTSFSLILDVYQDHLSRDHVHARGRGCFNRYKKCQLIIVLKGKTNAFPWSGLTRPRKWNLNKYIIK